MQTPIYDFLCEYRRKEVSRMHMPGHKGKGPLGCEALDITEVAGADALYEADGIIAQSEAAATELFGSGHTFYSTEGSSQCIRAMLYLAIKNTSGQKRPVIVAARNVHKAFLYAAALLDFDVVWVNAGSRSSLCQCSITPEDIEKTLSELPTIPAAVYITSPNYLGEQADISKIAQVCHRYHTLLAVDNAHGAYLHFLTPSSHPLDLGADLVCDSAHKTLPVLTGGAYLHIAKKLSGEYIARGKQALALFGSTSPSYLILASLDCCNAYLAANYERRLNTWVAELAQAKAQLMANGWHLADSDPLRITIHAPGDISGLVLAEKLREANIECEYAEEAYLVLMLTPENTKEELELLVHTLGQNLCRKDYSYILPDYPSVATVSIREAFFSEHEVIPVEEAEGRICGSPMVSCPPAIPIVVSGEIITEQAIRMFKHYGIPTVEVLK